ncbi:unnamed protein product [Triticum turgidum subsp. durum]|uniref:Uncharacterized protein n=1 Tax=Triticum turgidum subsp. durum TaxID=4567 RepID=A0A9R0T3F0_TRITD|nr:unnamed protein product [Triticum turgidum subsp. durum]
MPLPSSEMAEEHAGGQHEQQVAAERRARQKLLFAVPIIPIVMFIVAPCALFLFTADLALPRIRIEYARRDGDRDAPASALATAVAAVPSEEQQQLPPLRQLTDRPYSLGPNSSPRRCKDPEGDHVLLRAFKNKADYCRVHGFDIFYSNAVLDAEMNGFWTKLPLLRALMVAHPEVELLWWVDSDVVFTDMLFEPPWGKYARHNLLLHGWDDAVYGAKNWLGTNAGSFVIRNCQWSLDLLDAWARMGPRGPVRDRYGKVFAEALSNRAAYEADDQSALVYLLVTERGRWGAKVFLESSYLLHGFWEGIVDRYEEMRSKGRPGLGDDRWPLVTHFVGCKPCGEQSASYEAARCRQGMERALNFADDQILGLYGFQHESLNTTAVRRVRNDTGRPLDADDDQIGRLLHPEFRAANP